VSAVNEDHNLEVLTENLLNLDLYTLNASASAQFVREHF
jgi:hypothetical protein